MGRVGSHPKAILDELGVKLKISFFLQISHLSTTELISSYLCDQDVYIGLFVLDRYEMTSTSPLKFNPLKILRQPELI